MKKTSKLAGIGPTLIGIAIIGLAAAGSGTAEAARNQIHVVGSSTVYPFATVVAEEFGQRTKYDAPIIESTGSGGGLKLFCGGTGLDHPDITNASRRIKPSEVENCAANGVENITEVKIGYDGIVLANLEDGPQFDLTLKQVYLALAKEVPVDGEIRPNPYKRWNDIDPSLPDTPIYVMGPPPTSGTRDAFNELGLEAGCMTFPAIQKIEEEDADRAKQICRSVREDSASGQRIFVPSGENDNLIVQKLRKNPNALGIFGYSFLEQNPSIRGAKINGVAPGFEKISNGDYPLSRSLYFYVKNAHVGKVPGMREYIAEFTSNRAWGDFGYLTEKGLIPMPAQERKEYRQKAKDLTPLKLDGEM